MNENMLRFLMMAGFMAVALAIAAVSGELSSYSLSDPLEGLYPTIEYRTVTELLDEMPLDRRVSLSGNVSRVDDDFTSDRGYEYQQFYLSDGQSEIKVFCSKYSGSAVLREGDEVFLSGKLQRYYQSLEIYTECRSVNVL
jgi:hypothetical protein